MTPGQMAGWIGVAILFMAAVAIGEGVIGNMIKKHKKAKQRGTPRGLGE